MFVKIGCLHIYHLSVSCHGITSKWWYLLHAQNTISFKHLTGCSSYRTIVKSWFTFEQKICQTNILFSRILITKQWIITQVMKSLRFKV